MSALGVFLLGVVVTALVAAAVLPLFWAAVLDGRFDREQRLRLAALPEGTPPDTRTA